MSIDLNPIFEDMVRQFSTITTNERFTEDFVTAINKVLDELSFAGDLSTDITHIYAPSSTVSELDVSDNYIISSGVTFYLILSGREHVMKDNAYVIAKQEWASAKGDFMVKQSRKAQAEVSNDLSGSGASIIGLGDVTNIDRT